MVWRCREERERKKSVEGSWSWNWESRGRKGDLWMLSKRGTGLDVGRFTKMSNFAEFKIKLYHRECEFNTRTDWIIHSFQNYLRLIKLLRSEGFGRCIRKWANVTRRRSLRVQHQSPGGHDILSLRAGREPSQEQVQQSNWSTSAKVALPYQEGKCSGVCLHVRGSAAASEREGGRWREPSRGDWEPADRWRRRHKQGSGGSL